MEISESLEPETEAGGLSALQVTQPWTLLRAPEPSRAPRPEHQAVSHPSENSPCSGPTGCRVAPRFPRGLAPALPTWGSEAGPDGSRLGGRALFQASITRGHSSSVCIDWRAEMRLLSECWDPRHLLGGFIQAYLASSESTSPSQRLGLRGRQLLPSCEPGQPSA